jgi:DNA repair exonuclease SbcCD nuclease subunit
MNEIMISGEEVALLSDVHWGKSRDSDLKINTLNTYFDWYINILKERNIKVVLFLGDWFDNRNNISVKTLNQAYDTLKRFSDDGIKVYMIIGNHDSHLKNSIAVNSVKLYGDIKNIYPIEDLTEVYFTEGKRGLLCPWDTFERAQGTYDVLFGHFDFDGAYLKDSVHHSNCSMTSILERAPLAFSGHFHLRNTYNHKQGKLITVGCPVELDWGDAGNEKGVYILNTTTLDYEFIPNTFSPKHVKLYWSKIQAKTEDMKRVSGNYIKFVIDVEYKYEHIIKVTNLIDSLGPVLPCENDYVYNTSLNALEEFSVADDSLLTMSKLDYMRKYIEEYFKDADEADDSLDVDRMMKLTEDVYLRTEEN